MGVSTTVNNADALVRLYLAWLPDRGALFVAPRLPSLALSPWADPLSAAR